MKRSELEDLLDRYNVGPDETVHLEVHDRHSHHEEVKDPRLVIGTRAVHAQGSPFKLKLHLSNRRLVKDGR